MKKQQATPQWAKGAQALGLAAAVLVGVAADRALQAMTAEKPEPEPARVWIEFQNLQHGLDVAGMLGGNRRGLTVCTNAPITKGAWVPPHVDLSSNPNVCRFREPDSQQKLEVTGHSTISHNHFVDVGIMWKEKP